MIAKTLGHCQITSEIGKGGMGKVYQAKDQKLGRIVSRTFARPRTKLHTAQVPVPRSAFRAIREPQRGQFSSWPVRLTVDSGFQVPISSIRRRPGVHHETPWSAASAGRSVCPKRVTLKGGPVSGLKNKVSPAPVLIVLLNSTGKNTRIGDANRIRQWIERPALSAKK